MLQFTYLRGDSVTVSWLSVNLRLENSSHLISCTLPFHESFQYEFLEVLFLVLPFLRATGLGLFVTVHTQNSCDQSPHGGTEIVFAVHECCYRRILLCTLASQFQIFPLRTLVPLLFKNVLDRFSNAENLNNVSFSSWTARAPKTCHLFRWKILDSTFFCVKT